MSLTLKKRDDASTSGDRYSGSLGGFDAVTGTLYRRYTGPRLTSGSGRGYSYATAANQNYGDFSTSRSGDSTYGTAFWTAHFYVNSTSVNTNFGGFIHVETGTYPGANPWIAVGLQSNAAGGTGDSTLNFVVWGGMFTNAHIDTGVAIPMRQEFELRISVGRNSANNYDYLIAYRLIGGSTWVTIKTATAATSVSENFTHSFFGNCGATGSASSWSGRMGCPQIFAISTYSTEKSSAPSGADAITDFDGQKTTYYLDPTSGSDSNLGEVTGSPWQTFGKISTESLNGCLRWAKSGSGMRYVAALGGADYYSTGTLPDAEEIAYMFGLGIIECAGDGVVVKQVSTSTIHRLTTQATLYGYGTWLDTDTPNDVDTDTYTQCTWFKKITAASWSLTATKTYTYQTTETAANAFAFQNGAMLVPIEGANYAAVASTIESTPGTFYNDGTTLYVHPFNNVDPTAAGDGAIERTQPFAGQMGLTLAGTGQYVRGLKLSGTMGMFPTNLTSDTPASYLVYCNSNVCILQDLDLDWGGKHLIGATSGITGRRTIRIGVKYGRSYPYGSAHSDVDYIGTTSGSSSNDSQSHFRFSTWTSNDNSNYITHTNGGGRGLDKLSFVACRLSAAHDYNVAVPDIIYKGCSGRLISSYQGTSSDQLEVVDCTAEKISVPRGEFQRFAYRPSRRKITNSSNSGCKCYSGALLEAYFKDSILDFTGIEQVSQGIWVRSDSNHKMQMDRGAVFLRSGTPILYGFSNTTLTPYSGSGAIFRGVTFYVQSGTQAIFGAYNDGSTTADRTFAQLQTLGIIDADCALVGSVHADPITLTDTWPYPYNESDIVSSGGGGRIGLGL